MITSRHNSGISQCRQLLSSSVYRRKQQLFVMESFKVASLFIQTYPSLISHIYHKESVVLPDIFTSFKSDVVVDSLMDELSSMPSPSGVCIIAKCPEPTLFQPVSKGRYLYLDGVRDPSNLGAIFRSAAAFNVDGVLCSSDCADFFHPKTLRGSAGACFGVPVLLKSEHVFEDDNWRQLSWVLLEATGGATLSEMVLDEATVFVLGSEGEGVSEQCRSLPNVRSFTIPLSNSVESLNVAVTSALISYISQ